MRIDENRVATDAGLGGKKVDESVGISFQTKLIIIGKQQWNGTQSRIAQSTGILDMSVSFSLVAPL